MSDSPIQLVSLIVALPNVDLDKLKAMLAAPQLSHVALMEHIAVPPVEYGPEGWALQAPFVLRAPSRPRPTQLYSRPDPAFKHLVVPVAWPIRVEEVQERWWRVTSRPPFLWMAATSVFT